MKLSTSLRIKEFDSKKLKHFVIKNGLSLKILCTNFKTLNLLKSSNVSKPRASQTWWLLTLQGTFKTFLVPYGNQLHIALVHVYN